MRQLFKMPLILKRYREVMYDHIMRVLAKLEPTLECFFSAKDAAQIKVCFEIQEANQVLFEAGDGK